MSSCPHKALADYNFFDPAVIEDPFDFYRAAREEAPVYRLPDTDIYFVSRYEDVRQALKRTEDFSNDFLDQLNVPLKSKEAEAIYAQGWAVADTLLTVDPPRHATSV